MSRAPATRMWRSLLALLLGAVAVGAAAPAVEPAGAASTVEALFEDWRHFETPPLHEGAPDYRAATVERRRAELPRLRARLASLAASNASTDAGIDRALIRAEMNGFDFYTRVLRPWARDPAFYATVPTEQSDTP